MLKVKSLRFTFNSIEKKRLFISIILKNFKNFQKLSENVEIFQCC